jgi:hypothetical protein
MSDDSSTPLSLDATKRAAVRAMAARLRKPPYLLNPDAADAGAAKNADRIVVFPGGQVRALRPGTTSEFYTVEDTADPLAALVSEIARCTADEDRLEAVKQREQNVAQILEEKRHSPAYREL